MEEASNNLEYEKAALFRDRIHLIEALDDRGTPDEHVQPEVFAVDPTEALVKLRDILQSPNQVRIIEGIDIANLSGQEAVGSLVKFIIDVEGLAVMQRLLEGVVIDEETLALPFIAAVGPGGHHLGTAHTLARYRSEFYMPIVSDRQNYDKWREDGSRDAARRAHDVAGQLLAAYEPPPLDPATDRAMICGGPAMLEDTSAMLDARGFEVGNHHTGKLGDYVIERAFVEK